LEKRGILSQGYLWLIAPVVVSLNFQSQPIFSSSYLKHVCNLSRHSYVIFQLLFLVYLYVNLIHRCYKMPLSVTVSNCRLKNLLSTCTSIRQKQKGLFCNDLSDSTHENPPKIIASEYLKKRRFFKRQFDTVTERGIL
jgi:hypothetical protein